MSNLTIKRQISSDKGITLIALMITVIVLLIIGGVSILTGTESIDSTRLKGFYTELEIIQKRVDDIAATNESYVDGEGNTLYLKEQGEDLNDDQILLLEDIKLSENIDINPTNFRYFTAKKLEDILDLFKMKYNVFIDFDNRIVIAEEGIKVGNKTYYVLENTNYHLEQITTKNKGEIEGLTYAVIKYDEDIYKITVTPNNIIGDLSGNGFVKYKETTTRYWETSNNAELIVKLLVEYNMIYQDNNGNSIEKLIKVELDENNQPIVTEVTE